MKDTDLFIDTDEGTIPLNSPAKRNSFMDTPSKLVGTIILLILLVVVILYFKSGRIQSSVRQENSNAMQVRATEQASHPVPGAKPGQMDGDIVVVPGVETIVHSGLPGDVYIDLWYRTESPQLTYVKTYNGVEKVTNSASVLRLPRAKTAMATNGTLANLTEIESLSVLVPTDQFTNKPPANLKIHWEISRE